MEEGKKKEYFIEIQTSNNSDQVSSSAIAAAPLDGLKKQSEKAQQRVYYTHSTQQA